VALTKEQKSAVVEEVAAAVATAHSAVAAEYRGIEANDMNVLRQKAREGGVYLRVVKNSLAKRAIENTDFECIKDHLSGPLLLAFSQEDPGAAARVIRDFAKDNAKLVVRLTAIGGSVMGPESLKQMADLPTKDQAIAILMGVMKAPIEKLVRTMAEPYAQVVRVVNAVSEAKKA